MTSPFKRWPLLVTFAALGAIAVVAACSSGTTTVVVADGGTSCGDGSQLCGSSCTVVARDPENCGACGKACAAGEVCSQGACAASCGGGTTKCGSSCVDTKADGQNCGACGTKCNAGEVCSAGKCTTSCGAGTSQCGNSCVNTQIDPTNCGACGTLCNAGEACSAGKCELSCQAGLTVCTKIAPDGGVADAAPDAVADASSDAVADASSDAGPVLGTPYCANLQSDDQNCGGCSIACGAGTQCVAGACAPTCAQPTTLCGGACADLQTDPSNCGACGKTCAASYACLSGACKHTKPVAPCESGSDPTNANLTWVVCSASSAGAVVSMLSGGGGQYHAQAICKQLGYSGTLGSIAGTYGNVCTGASAGGTSCSNPQNPFTFNGAGACGSDSLGTILCNTVMWQCAP